jgi:hypothetical protein
MKNRIWRGFAEQRRVARAPLPSYRVYNNVTRLGIDSNHRYTTNLAENNALLAKGWVREGGIMCAMRWQRDRKYVRIKYLRRKTGTFQEISPEKCLFCAAGI